MTADERLAAVRREVDRLDLTIRALRASDKPGDAMILLRSVDVYIRAIVLHVEQLGELAHAVKGG